MYLKPQALSARNEHMFRALYDLKLQQGQNVHGLEHCLNI